MPTLETLIVDDERLVRSELRRMLEPHDEVAVVGEAADATEAEAAVEELEPDLLLLARFDHEWVEDWYPAT